ncbi:MAG: hypothetical protein ABF925_06480, partial [Lentilactobacillus hilgardii]
TNSSNLPFSYILRVPFTGLFNGSICVPQIAASLLSFVLFPVLGSSFPVMIAVAGIAMGIGAIIVHFVNSNYFGK